MKFAIGVILGLLLFPLLGVLYVTSGRMPAAATDPPMPFEGAIAGVALNARIRRAAPTRNVSGFTTQELVSGADIYQNDCAFCHGLPQQPMPTAAQGEYPRPPQLFTPDGRVSDDPPGVTYWKVKNGIRLTGMPSFEKSLTDYQLWQVTTLVSRADNLPPEVLSSLKPLPSPAIGSSGALALPTPPASKPH
jgi:thiosulfate dehydrogenase